MQSSEFKKIVYQVGAQIQALVEAVYEPAITPNFFVAKLKHGGGVVFVLCTRTGEWGFCRNYTPDVCTLEFMDCSEFSQELEKSFGFNAFSGLELESGLTALSHMSASDIAYWKPRTFGEAVFNWWD